MRFRPYILIDIFNHYSAQKHLGFLSVTFIDLRKISLNLSFFICSLKILPLISPHGVLKMKMTQYNGWGIGDSQ